MGRGFGFKPLVLILSLVVSTLAHGAADDPEAGWTQTKTDYGLILLFTNQLYPCTKSQANFLSCVHLINSLGENTTPRYALVPKDKISSTPGMKGEVLMTYKNGGADSALVLARIDSTGTEPTTMKERAEKLKLDATDLKNAAAADFQNQINLDFDVTALELLKRKSPKISLQRMVGRAVNALILVHDGHGRVEPFDYYSAKLKSADEKFFGIGAQLEMVGKKLTVQGLVDGTPAKLACEKSKAENCLRAKDIITKIDNTTTEDLSLDDAVARIRGKDKTDISLEVNRDNETVMVKITRAPVIVPNVNGKELNDFGTKVAHIRIKEFDGNTCPDVFAKIEKLSPDTKGIILDLRGNRGGRLDASICLGGLFVGKKLIVGSREIRNGVTESQLNPFVSSQVKVTDLPVVVLINEVSASASEIIAGALQDHKRALIVGTRSFGKGTVQTGNRWNVVPDLMRFETTARFYMPSDRTNQIVGILPDIEVQAHPDLTEDEKFSLREEERVPSALPPVGAAWKQPRPDVMTKVSNECFTGRSESLLRTQGDGADYQLLKAEEILNCDVGVAAAVSPVQTPAKKKVSNWIAPISWFSPGN